MLLDEGSGTVFRLCPIGTLIWDALDGEATVREIASAFGEVLRADCEDVARDICCFLERLVKRGLVLGRPVISSTKKGLGRNSPRQPQSDYRWERKGHLT